MRIGGGMGDVKAAVKMKAMVEFGFSEPIPSSEELVAAFRDGIHQSVIRGAVKVRVIVEARDDEDFQELESVCFIAERVLESLRTSHQVLEGDVDELLVNRQRTLRRHCRIWIVAAEGLQAAS